MSVHLSQASAVIVQRVPADAVDWFLQWQGDATRAAEAFPGYCGTDVFPPSDGGPEQWVVLIHFEDQPSLSRWLESPVRSEFLKTLTARVGGFDLRSLPGGFGPWFAANSASRPGGPPGWKMVLTVLLGLFPTVMLLTIFVGPLTAPLGLALSMLIGNALSVSILQWGAMPVLTRLLKPWLNPTETTPKRMSLLGTSLIGLVLGTLAVLFRQVTG